MAGLKGDYLGLSGTSFRTVLRTDFRTVQIENFGLSRTFLTG